MSKLLRRWWTNTYELEPQVKIKSIFRLLQHEGAFTDENELLIDGIPIIVFEAGTAHWKGVIRFEHYDKPYELRFNYSIWSGNPKSAVILQNDRILAQYGNDSALKISNTVPFQYLNS